MTTFCYGVYIFN